MIHTLLGKCVCAGTCICLAAFSAFVITKINSLPKTIIDEKIIDSIV